MTSNAVNIAAKGPDGVIDLSGLTSWAGNSYQSSLSVTDGATVDDGNLTTLSGVDVTLDGTGALAVSQWQSLTDGGLDITGGDYAPTAGTATPSIPSRISRTSMARGYTSGRRKPELPRRRAIAMSPGMPISKSPGRKTCSACRP